MIDMENRNNSGALGDFSGQSEFLAHEEQIEDAYLEEVLGCLAPAPKLSDRIKRSLPLKPRKQSWLLRISSIAALLIIGIAIGVLVPTGDLLVEQEAEAASLRDNISGYAQSSRFFSQEAQLLGNLSEPSLASRLANYQFQLSSLKPSAELIQSRLRRTPPKGSNEHEYKLLVSFFDSAVRRIYEIEDVLGRSQFDPNAIAFISKASREIVPPSDLKVTASKAFAPVSDFSVSDPELNGYISAKRFIYAGEPEKAIPYLLNVRNSSRSEVSSLSGFWLTRCFLETGDIDSAVVQYRTLPTMIQRLVVIPSQTVRSGAVISITIGNTFNESYESLHVVRSSSGAITVITFPNGTVKAVENGVVEENFDSLEAFKLRRPELYRRAFLLDRE